MTGLGDEEVAPPAQDPHRLPSTSRTLASGSPENFRRLGIRQVFPVSAEHGQGIGELLDAISAAIPAKPEDLAAATATAEGKLTPPEQGLVSGHDSAAIPDPPRQTRREAEF